MAVVKKKAKFKAGQWIFIPYSPDPLKAQILEDMGSMGADGEHVYFIHVPELDDGEEEYTRDISERFVIGPA